MPAATASARRAEWELGARVGICGFSPLTGEGCVGIEKSGNRRENLRRNGPGRPGSITTAGVLMLRRLETFHLPVPLTRAGLVLGALVFAVLALTSTFGSKAVAADRSIEAETMSLPSNQGQPFSDSSASGGQGLLIWSSGTAS